MEIACFGAVNLYALITGYVCIESKHRWHRIIELWLEVLFYSLLFTIIYTFIPHTYWSVTDFAKVFLPISTNLYWYFSSYFGLFIFIPFLNILIKNLNKHQHKFLIISIIFSFCIINWFSMVLHVDVFHLADGYSLLWLISMYIIGSYIKLHNKDFEKYNKNLFLQIYVLMVLITLLLHLFSKLTLIKMGISITFVSYISPLILLGSICLFIYFSKLTNVTSKITNLSCLTFGIYLIDTHPKVVEVILNNCFSRIANKPIVIIYVLISSILFFIIACIIDYIRSNIFKKLSIQKFCEKIVNIVKQSKLVKKI